MAVCKMDLHKQERKIDTQYRLDTKEGVEILLKHLPYLREERFQHGNYAVSTLLMDLEKAMEKAELTHIEQTAIELVYVQDLKFKDASKRCKYSDAGLHKALNRAVERIAMAFDMWRYDDVLF